MALDYAKKAKIVIFVDCILFVYICLVVLICHRVFWDDIVYWSWDIGIKTSTNNLSLLLFLFYVMLAAIWLSLIYLLHHGVKQRSSIKLLVWSLLHFVILVPYTISAVFAISYNYKLSPILLYVLYRAFILWVVNGFNPEIIRQRRQSQIYRG